MCGTHSVICTLCGIGMFLGDSTPIPREVCSVILAVMSWLVTFLQSCILFLNISFSSQYYILLCYLIWLLILKILSCVCVYTCTHMRAHIHMHIWTCAEHDIQSGLYAAQIHHQNTCWTNIWIVKMFCPLTILSKLFLCLLQIKHLVLISNSMYFFRWC